MYRKLARVCSAAPAPQVREAGARAGGVGASARAQIGAMGHTDC